MQKLLEKIKLATHSAARTAEIEEVASDLVSMRFDIYFYRLMNPKKLHHPDMKINFSEFRKKTSSNDSDTSKTLGTLNWIFVQLGLIKHDQVLKSPEKSLPTAWRGHHEKCEKVLSS